MASITESRERGLARLRHTLVDQEVLVRAVASGRMRGRAPAWRRVELRYVDLKAGRHLQITTYDATQAHTSNHAAGEPAAKALDALLDEPFGHWHVDTTTQTHQLRITKKLDAVVHSTDRAEPVPAARDHDREKPRALPEDAPLLRVLGISDGEGRVKPTRRAKYRQVEEFVRLLGVTIDDALSKGHLREPTSQDPWRVVDLGCGNAYLTFAAQHYLTQLRGWPVRLIGVDVKEQSRQHNEAVAKRLGLPEGAATFVVGGIADVEIGDESPDVVLALHACDTATDDALARGITWQAPVVLAAPCCHHDIAAQMRRSAPPAPYDLVIRHGILRERFADTLTDALRAALLRMSGYRVDVVEFVGSEHTPRNTLLRAVHTGSPTRGDEVRREYDDLVDAWGVLPRLGQLLETTTTPAADA